MAPNVMKDVWKAFADPNQPGGIPLRKEARAYFMQALRPEWVVDLGRPTGVDGVNPQLGGLADEIQEVVATVVRLLDEIVDRAIATVVAHGQEKNLSLAKNYKRKHIIDPNGHLLYALRGPAPFQTLATLWEVLSSRARDAMRLLEQLTGGSSNKTQVLTSPARTSRVRVRVRG
jgi:hypothetical protein